MTSDVEIITPQQVPDSSSATSRSPSPHHHAPTPIDADNAHDAAPSTSTLNGKSSPETTNGVVKIKENGTVKEKKSKPSPSVTAVGKPASTATGAKPKSTKSAAARSPSPSPPPPTRPPLQTIRLDIRLGGPEAYEVDIAALSKATGQRQPTPPPPSKRDTSDDSHSEGDDEGDGKKNEKKRKRVSVVRYYSYTCADASSRERILHRNTTMSTTHSLTTLNWHRMNGRSLHRQNRRASMSPVVKSLCSIST